MWNIQCPDRKKSLQADALTLITDGKEIYYICDICSGIHNIIKNNEKEISDGHQKCGIANRRDGHEQIDLQEQIGQCKLQSPYCHAGSLRTIASGGKSRKVQQH